MIQEAPTTGINCHTCNHSKLLSDAVPTYECHAPFGEHDVMTLLYEFVESGQVKAPFIVVSTQDALHDAWPLRFRASTIKSCEGHSSITTSNLRAAQALICTPQISPEVANA